MDFSKYLGAVGLAELWDLMIAQMDSRVFIGTRAEYEANINNIPIGAIVVITDESDVVQPPVEEKPIVPPADNPPAEEEPSVSLTAAKLGTALLGKMILGQL